MVNVLDVYFNNVLAGSLIKEKELVFKYDEEYFKSDNLPISASMPKNTISYQGDVVETFFQGLLPDDSVKKVIARILQTNEENTFRLLEEIGRDCAGAIALYKKGVKPFEYTNPQYKRIEDDKAFEILTNLKKRPLYIGEDDFRVSGAGAQDKLVACIFDNTLYLPLYGTPSTHIIKPNIEGFNNTTYNELFCMKLAQKCELETPNCFIKKINNIPFYVVERYDRKYNNLKEIKNIRSIKSIRGDIDGKFISRIHQEDFCQILNVLPQNKYEADGGPSYKDCFELLNNIGVSGHSKIAFLDLIIFNYLIGNGDAHAKNFSIIYKDNKPELAPCYDLMCTAIIAPYYSKANMAMKLSSKKYLMSKVTRQKVALLEEVSGYKQDYILKRVDHMCSVVSKNAPLLVAELNADKNTTSVVYDDILKIINAHCSRLSK